MSSSSEVEVYQLRVFLRQISPMIWRRLLVRSDSTIADLHYTLQIAMGWDDFHLHQFTIRGKYYGVAYECGPLFSDDAEDVRLSDFQFRRYERFLYEYDFGDLRALATFVRKRPLRASYLWSDAKKEPLFTMSWATESTGRLQQYAPENTMKHPSLANTIS